jgi:hypothetical protein
MAVREHPDADTETLRTGFWDCSTDRIGEVNADEVNAWIEAARQLARDAGRGEVAYVQIGKVLAHAHAANTAPS